MKYRKFLYQFVFQLYRVCIIPLWTFLAGPSAGCRFEESCSRFAERHLIEFGFFRSISKIIFRILRCQPWIKTEESSNG